MPNLKKWPDQVAISLKHFHHKSNNFFFISFRHWWHYHDKRCSMQDNCAIVEYTDMCSQMIAMFGVVNFDALAQASDIRIERRQVVFLCWMQDSNPRSQIPTRQQTECPLTNRLNYRGSSLKLELDSPSLWSASIQPTRPHCQLTFAPGSGDIHVWCCYFLFSRWQTAWAIEDQA